MVEVQPFFVSKNEILKAKNTLLQANDTCIFKYMIEIFMEFFNTENVFFSQFPRKLGRKLTLYT